jgi:hypothetical protein
MIRGKEARRRRRLEEEDKIVKLLFQVPTVASSNVCVRLHQQQFGNFFAMSKNPN